MQSLILHTKDQQIWAAQILGIQKAQRQGHILPSFQSSVLPLLNIFMDLNFLPSKSAIYQYYVLGGHSNTMRANEEWSKCNTMHLPTGTYNNGSKAQDLDPGISDFINKS